MARQPSKPDQSAQDDSAALHAAVQEVIDEMGRGGLSWMAERVGMTVSALRRRLLVPGKAFDAPTLRAVATLMELRREQEAQPPAPTEDTPEPAHS